MWDRNVKELCCLQYWKFPWHLCKSFSKNILLVNGNTSNVNSKDYNNDNHNTNISNDINENYGSSDCPNLDQILREKNYQNIPPLKLFPSELW